MGCDFIKRLWIIQWIINKFLPEFIYLVKLAWPIILMNLFRFLNPTISVIMCGHLTKTDFDAAALANALINVFGVSVDFGFSTACDTLFAQIYGSVNRNRLGLMLQRAILVMTILYLLLACFHLNIEPILILLYQDVEISRRTAKYVALYLPGLFFDFHFLAISRYLQNQNIVFPMMISSFISCIYNIVIQYVAIYVFNYGIEASAIIQASGCFVSFAIQLGYVLISKVYKSTWKGIEFTNALNGWGIFFKLGLPGIVMIGVEEWSFEIANFVAGSISDVQLGAQSIAFQIGTLCYMLHTGLAIAVSIRTGQYLGANKPREASLMVKIVLISDLMISICASVTIISLRSYIPRLFTNDDEICLLAEKILLLIGFIMYFDAGLSSSAALFRACGRQLQGAIIMIVTYYGLGVPLAFVLVYVVKTDIRGFWIGLWVALAIEVFIYLIIISKIDWNVEASKAQIRIKESRISDTRSSETRIDDFSTALISETSNLLDSSDDTLEVEMPIPIIHKPSHRRPTSGVTDILQSSIKNVSDIPLDMKLSKNTIIKRIIFCFITLVLFTTSILLKIYLPRRLYIPCIPVNNATTTLALDKHYPFCNDSIYNF